MINKTKKNFIYNLLYQILILFIPLVISPYLTRTIGANGVGTYAYTYSIVSYFILISMLGINNYGNRECAKVSRDKEKLSNTFISIYTIEFTMTIIMSILYLIYILIFNNEYKNIALIQSILLLSSLFDINWFFFGIEKFKLTITKNSVIKIINMILIFIFVKTPDDLWKYVLIMAIMTLLSQIALWPQLKKYIIYTHVSIKDIKKHIKPCIILFIPVIAISLYKIMDKIMIGFLLNTTEVGFYDSGEKIITVCFTIINSLGTVMLPRISNLISSGEIGKVKYYISKSIKFIMFLSFPMWLGLLCIGSEFSIIYFGNGFERAGIVIKLLSITIPIVSWATVIRTQYLIPKEKDKEYLVSVCFGAIINLIINLIFIPKYGVIGACIGTVVAEIVVMLIQTLSVIKEINIKQYLNEVSKFFIKSLIMFFIVYSIKYLRINSVKKILIQIILGSFIYGILNIKYILSIINISEFKRKVLRK